jgi:hypothetical protein
VVRGSKADIPRETQPDKGLTQAMTTKIEGRFCRIKNRLPYGARVTIQIAMETTKPEILVQCSGTPLHLTGFSQGDIEDVPAVGYEDWKQGAVVGVRYALQVVGHSDCHVTITRILGMTTETNPTVVGAAAVDAVWKALDYSPSLMEVHQVEQRVFASSQLAYDALPNFSPNQAT